MNVKSFVWDLGRIETDYELDYYFVFEEVKRMFAEMVETRDFSLIKPIINKYDVNGSDIISDNIEYYIEEDENGRIPIGESRYTFPKFMFATMNLLIKKAITELSTAHFNDYVSENKNSLLNVDLASLALLYKTYYYKHMKNELKNHNDIAKVSKVNSMYITDNYETKEDFINASIHTGILQACLDFMMKDDQKIIEFKNLG